MKFLDRAITRFCYKHPRFGIRNLMLSVVAGTAIIYLFSMMDTTGTLVTYIHFNPALILRGQVWRLVTFIFMPYSDSVFTLIISLYFYYFIGSTLERQWGTGRFTIFYLSGVLFNVVFGFLAFYIPLWVGGEAAVFSINALFMSATYLHLSMFFAFASIWPDQMVLLFFIIPIKMKWLAWFDAAFFVYSIVTQMSIFPINLLPIVAFLNFFIFCGSNLFANFSRDRKVSHRRSEFNAAMHQAKNEQELKNYRHKCAVCGRTDVSHPELEFRYCSRCEGYHCFCEDHINNHVHFTE